MKIGVVAPVAVRIPVVGYGGIEFGAQWLAAEFVRRGHEVTVFANVDDGPSELGWTGVHLETESDILTPEKLALARSCDAVSDWTHLKFLRMGRLKNYRATTMWTDTAGYPGQSVYPSEAVREAFKDPKAPVIPIGIPVDGVAVTGKTGGPYVCLGRIAPYKGQDLSILIAQAAGVTLTVAGHTGAYADPYFPLVIRERCELAKFPFVPDPPDLETLLDGAGGLLHTHRWIESFSIVAAQALVRGVPILTTDIGAVQEWVRACDGGMVVPLKDLEAGRWEAAGVKDFFQMKLDSRREGVAKRARELFDVRNVAARYLELFGGK